MSSLQPHAAADIFPLMSGVEFEALIADIRDHGQREPIVLHEGKILDGRNRLRACQQIGVEPKFKTWVPEGTPQEFVVSMNLHRRHLNESQRAMIAARLLTTVEISTPASGHDDSGRFAKADLTAEAAGEMLNVNRHTVFSAKKVLHEGTPEEIEAVEKGEAAVSTIARQIRKGQPKETRKKKRDFTLAQTGRNPERIQKQQINAEIWGRIRDTLTHLTSLPLPSDVAAIARANDKTGFVEPKLAPALTWLKEFCDEWKRDADA